MTDQDLVREPRWPAVLAVLAVGGLRLALPGSLAVGPNWLLLVVELGVLVPMVAALVWGSHRLTESLGFVLNGLMTVDMLWSLLLLVHALPRHTEAPGALLRSAAALWVTNVLVFASWYWRLDAGGPHAREQRTEHSAGSFLFPQMQMERGLRDAMGFGGWRPGFIDYLFLSFNTSTAFSPTDSPVLDGWAKVLMMVQAGVSFLTVALLVSRAVGVL